MREWCSRDRYAVVQSPIDGDWRIVLELQAQDCFPWRTVAAGTEEAMHAVARLCEHDYHPLPTERWRIR